MASSFFKVSNRGTQDMDYSTQRRIRWETRFDSVYGEPLQVSWNRRIRNSLYACIPKLVGLSQSNWKLW